VYDSSPYKHENVAHPTRKDVGFTFAAVALGLFIELQVDFCKLELIFTQASMQLSLLLQSLCNTINSIDTITIDTFTLSAIALDSACNCR
jgi:hypothetical protein